MKWERKTLGKVLSLIKTGKTPPSKEAKYFDGDICWFTPADIGLSKDLILSKKTITNLAITENKATLYPACSLLVTCIGEIGRVGIAKERVSSNQQITAVVPNDSIDVDWLYYWFIKNNSVLKSKANNAVVPILNNAQLRKIGILYPPFPIQRQIAELLDTATALRQRTEDQLAELDRLAESVFLDMFGDPVRNEKGWEVVTLNDLGVLERGKSKHRPRNAPELLGGPYPLIQTGDVANSNGYITKYYSTYSELGLSQSKLWSEGTLCITIAANIAKTGILKFKACFPDSVVGFIPHDNCLTEYVQYWLQFLQETIEASAPESAQKNINLKILRELDIPLPPLPLQTHFAQIIENLEAQKAVLRRSLQESEDLVGCLLQEVFA